jgi:hypothetical protein
VNKTSPTLHLQDVAIYLHYDLMFSHSDICTLSDTEFDIISWIMLIFIVKKEDIKTQTGLNSVGNGAHGCLL